MAPLNPVTIGPVQIGRNCPLALIAGPCVMEPGDMTERIARQLVEICTKLGVPSSSRHRSTRPTGRPLRVIADPGWSTECGS